MKPKLSARYLRRMGLKWYRDRKSQRVNDSHKVERVQMAEYWEKMSTVDPDWHKRTWWSDESLFLLKSVIFNFWTFQVEQP